MATPKVDPKSMTALFGLQRLIGSSKIGLLIAAVALLYLDCKYNEGNLKTEIMYVFGGVVAANTAEDVAEKLGKK